MKDRPIWLGKFRCTECARMFLLQPGAHELSFCPHCRSEYYEWIDYSSFALSDEPETR